VHWFQEHPTFRNGGLVALSEYEDGVRFLQIGRDGKITEQGYFAALGSSSSSPKWAGKDDVLYSIDYDRGIDIIRWRGEHYVPGKDGRPIAEPDREPGTGGETPLPPLTAEQQQRQAQLFGELSAQNALPYYCQLAGQQ
jgi:hypothetical protein